MLLGYADKLAQRLYAIRFCLKSIVIKLLQVKIYKNPAAKYGHPRVALKYVYEVRRTITC